MAELQALAVRHPMWRKVWTTLILAGLSGVAAGVAAVIAAYTPAGFEQTALGTAVTLVTLLGGCTAAALLIAAAFMTSAAGQADRLNEEFRRGDLIARWTFPPHEWEAFLAKPQPTAAAQRWMITFVCVFVIGVIGMAAAQTVEDPHVRTHWLAVLAAGCILLCWPVFRLTRCLIERRIARMRTMPWVLIGRRGINYGGELTQWGRAGTVLREVCVVSGDTSLLKLVTGAGQSAQALDTAAVAINVLALVAGEGGIAGTGGSKARTEVFLPIPGGDAVEAARVIAALLATATVPRGTELASAKP